MAAAEGRLSVLAAHVAVPVPTQAPSTAVLHHPTPQDAAKALPFDAMPGPWRTTDRDGNTRELDANRPDHSSHLHVWHLQYGDVYRYRARLRNGQMMDTVVIGDPALVSGFHSENVRKLDQYQDMVMLGEGVLTNNGELWELQRELLKPAFTPESLKKHLDTAMYRCIDRSLLLIADAAEKHKQLDIWEELPRLTFEIIGHAALGEGADFIDTVSEPLRHAFDIVSVATFRPPKEKYPGFLEAYAYMRSFAAEVLARAEKREQASPGKCPVAHAAGHGAAVSPLQLIRTRTSDDKPLLSLKLQEDELFTLMFAGHETTAHTLGWLVTELCRAPHLQERLRESIFAQPEFKRAQEQVPKSSSGPLNEAYRHLSYGDLLKFETVTKYINETLRRWPVVAIGTERGTECDTVIGGYHVPAGTMVRTPHVVMHWHPRLWTNPMEFNPDRKWNNAAFMAFSRGPRDCLGRTLAMMEMRAIAIALFSNFRIKSTTPLTNMRIYESATTRLRGPLPVLFERLPNH